MQDNERKAWHKGGSAAKAIGAYVARMLDPVARARGFAITSLLSEWPTVVGEELASFTAPDKLMWPRRTEDREAASPQSAWRNDGAILVLKVDGPRAIELQHRSEQILERVNMYFGYRAIAQLRFLQAPLPKAKSQAPTPPPSVEEPSARRTALPTRGLPRPLGGLGQASAARRRDLEGLIFPERRRTQVCKENSPGSSEKPGLLGCRSNRA